jgi:hypothetical protein
MIVWTIESSEIPIDQDELLPEALPEPKDAVNLNEEPEMPLDAIPLDLGLITEEVDMPDPTPPPLPGEEANAPSPKEAKEADGADEPFTGKTRGGPQNRVFPDEDGKLTGKTSKMAWKEADPADPSKPEWKPMPDRVRLDGVEQTPQESADTGEAINMTWVDGQSNNDAIRYAKSHGSSEAEFHQVKQVYKEIYLERLEARKEIRMIGAHAPSARPYIKYGHVSRSATQRPGEERTVDGEARHRMKASVT